MENLSTIKVPQKYQPHIALLDDEGDLYSCTTVTGYRFASTGCHSAIGYTQKEILTDIRTIEPCTCAKCAS